MERDRKPMDTCWSWLWKKLFAENDDDDGNDEIVVSVLFAIDCGRG